MRIRVTIPAAGWSGEPESGILIRNGNADPPEGAALLVDYDGAGTIGVYADPCHWSTAESINAPWPDQVAEALAAQPGREAWAQWM